MINIGLIGCGNVAYWAHAPAIKQISDFNLKAVYDPDLSQAQKIGQDFGVEHIFDDIDDFYACGLDAVAIASSAPAHKQNVLDAARYGKPALCEKPLALTNTDAEIMIEAMHAAEVPLYTAFCYRFSPSAMRIRELVRNHTIGEVRVLRLIYNWHLHGRYEMDDEGRMILNQMRVGRMLEGGPMIDCGTHQIDLAQWWLDSEVVRYTASGAWVEDYEAPDHIFLHMDHAGGQHTMVEISFSYGAHVKDPSPLFAYELIGTDGMIRYDRSFRSFEIRTPHATWHEEFHDEKNFTAMYAAFAHGLKTGNYGELATAEEGRIVAEIAARATDHVIANRPGIK